MKSALRRRWAGTAGYVFSEGVSQENMLKTARLLVESGFSNYSYHYVNIDDCWQGERGGREGAIQPNDRFPDMNALCRSIHRLGLRAGIYSTPWMGTYAGHIGGSMPNNRGDYSALSLSPKLRPARHQIFGRYLGTLKQKADRVGPVWKMDENARQWANRGFDYVKMDWKPNDIPTAQRIATALKRCSRDMVLSLSSEAPWKTDLRWRTSPTCGERRATFPTTGTVWRVSPLRRKNNNT